MEITDFAKNFEDMASTNIFDGIQEPNETGLLDEDVSRIPDSVVMDSLEYARELKEREIRCRQNLFAASQLNKKTFMHRMLQHNVKQDKQQDVLEQELLANLLNLDNNSSISVSTDEEVDAFAKNIIVQLLKLNADAEEQSKLNWFTGLMSLPETDFRVSLEKDRTLGDLYHSTRGTIMEARRQAELTRRLNAVPPKLESERKTITDRLDRELGILEDNKLAISLVKMVKQPTDNTDEVAFICGNCGKESRTVGNFYTMNFLTKEYVDTALNESTSRESMGYILAATFTPKICEHCNARNILSKDAMQAITQASLQSGHVCKVIPNGELDTLQVSSTKLTRIFEDYRTVKGDSLHKDEATYLPEVEPIQILMTEDLVDTNEIFASRDEVLQRHLEHMDRIISAHKFQNVSRERTIAYYKWLIRHLSPGKYNLEDSGILGSLYARISSNTNLMRKISAYKDEILREDLLYKYEKLKDCAGVCVEKDIVYSGMCIDSLSSQASLLEQGNKDELRHSIKINLANLHMTLIASDLAPDNGKRLLEGLYPFDKEYLLDLYERILRLTAAECVVANKDSIIFFGCQTVRDCIKNTSPLKKCIVRNSLGGFKGGVNAEVNEYYSSPNTQEHCMSFVLSILLAVSDISEDKYFEQITGAALSLINIQELPQFKISHEQFYLSILEEVPAISDEFDRVRDAICATNDLDRIADYLDNLSNSSDSDDGDEISGIRGRDPTDLIFAVCKDILENNLPEISENVESLRESFENYKKYSVLNLTLGNEDETT